MKQLAELQEKIVHAQAQIQLQVELMNVISLALTDACNTIDELKKENEALRLKGFG